MHDFIEGIPKAELHVHLEGTLEPAMMLALAERNGIDLPYGSESEVANAYHFDSLQAFLNLYYQGIQVLINEQDFHDLAWRYFESAARQNVRRAEVFFDPQAHTGRGIDFSTVITGFESAVRAARQDLGLSVDLIMCFLRHLPAADAMRTLDTALAFGDKFIAVGLDSSEKGNPPRRFAEVFAHARANGLRTVAHAGEEGPAEYVREALDELRVERIDHGNNALDDAALVQRLAVSQVPLTVCPISNLKLGLIGEMKNHPLRRMMDSGLNVTINSDDPAYFGGDLNANYIAVQEAQGLERSDILALARASFASSFLPQREKETYIAELQAAGEDPDTGVDIGADYEPI